MGFKIKNESKDTEIYLENFDGYVTLHAKKDDNHSGLLTIEEDGTITLWQQAKGVLKEMGFQVEKGKRKDTEYVKIVKE